MRKKSVRRKIVQAHQQGYKMSVIASMFDVSFSYVQSICSKYIEKPVH